MFRAKSAGSFASKIAHTSTLPVLGNKDLKLLQDVILNEKTVLSTLQRLAVDLSRASDSLKAWGLGEGDDLGDVLTHATNMYSHITAALNNFANHEHAVRTQLKAIRTREERLDETKRKRKSVAAKADAADKKLSKMSGENKNLPAQTELLNKLRDEIRQLDTDIMVEEARLGDFKRLCARNFMSLKLGALLEFGEKATIVGELGKLLIEEIPTEPTPPGQPRFYYQGHSKTEQLNAEAERCIGEVVFTAPPEISESPVKYPPEVVGRGPSEDDPTPVGDLGLGYNANDTHGRARSDLDVLPSQEGLDEFGESNQVHRRYASGPTRTGEEDQRMGISGGGGGGHFNTFPVKARSGSVTGDQGIGAIKADASNELEFSPSMNVIISPPAPAPSFNVGAGPWNGDEKDTRYEDQGVSQLSYISSEPAHSRSELRDTLSVEKGVRFRTPSMEVSGMGPVAPGVASPVHPSSGWRGRASHDVSVSPLRPQVEAEPEFVDNLPDDMFPNNEHTLNTAAAREIARELDSLAFTPSPSQTQYPPSPTIAANLPPVLPLSINRAPSPLTPPAAPFTQQRSVSPSSPGSSQPASPMTQSFSHSGSSILPPEEVSMPYGAPPEYTAVVPSSSSGQLGGGSSRTISAAAFKRGARTGSEAEMNKKRPLPSNPRPAPLRSMAGGSIDNLAGVGSGGGQRQLPPGAQPPDHFQIRDPGSPVTGDYGNLGNVKVVNSEPGDELNNL